MMSPPLLLTLLLFFGTLLVRQLQGSGDECLTKWVSTRLISQQAAYLGELTDVDSKTQWLFPELRITCSTTITKIRFVGETLQGGNRIPELQMWRKVSPTSTRYSKIHHTSRDAGMIIVRPNLYSMSVSWQVQPGDVFGVYQPDTKRSRYSFAMQERGGGEELSYMLRNRRRAPDRFDASKYDTSSHPYPLVSVEAGDRECVSQFLSLFTLIQKSIVKSGVDQPNTSQLSSDSDRVRIFPEIKFDCNGRITRAIFAAESKGLLTSHTQVWPELQIWLVSSTGSYNRRNRATLEGARVTSDLNVYEKSFNPPLSFRSGDTLGVYFPPEGSTSLQLYLLGGLFALNKPSYSIQQSSWLNLFNINIAESDNSVPLLSLDSEIAADCEQPASPVHGMVTVADYLATYQCDEGYNLAGHRERTCDTSNGVWTHSPPTCQAVHCEVAPSLSNGQVKYDNPTQSTVFNSVVMYSCDVGFELSGNSTRQCTASGDWSGSNPTCTGIQCSELDIPSHGSAEVENDSPDTQLNTRAIYSCSAGYTLVGERVRVCNEDKEWNGSAPQCIQDCPPPPNITNGVINTPPRGTPLYTVVEYSCEMGTRMVGNETLECLEDGKWSSDPPICKDITCVRLKNPKNGKVNLNNGTVYRAQAHYNCNSNFLLKGNNTRICQVDGNWSGKMPKCVYRKDYATTPEPEISNDYPFTSVAPPIMRMSTDPHFVVSAPLVIMGTQDTAIAIVIAVLCLIIVCMIAAIVCVYARRRMKKRIIDHSMTMAIADLQDNSIENPMYGVDHRFSFNLWDPHTTPAPPSPADGEDTTLYSNPAYYDCDQSASTKSPSIRKSLYYDVSSIMNPAAADGHYEVMDFDTHYETASNFQFELPALPYEVPTPSSKYPPIVYGSLPWGTYVPTKEERSATYSNVPPIATPSTPVSLKSHGSVASIQAFFQECDIYWKPASDSAGLYEQLAKNKYRELLRHQIQITENLGSGQFGRVVKGLWQSPVGVLPVAVKMLKEETAESDEVRFLQEAAINGQFQHRNVVKLHGVVTLGRPVMIVLELCPNGDLRDYLIQARPSPGEILASDWPQRLLQFCKDVACGMEYLSRKAFVHRDLAARNILVAQDMTCKISDFGLSRDLEHESYYISHGGKIPVKWTAPEAIHYKKYSTASDVWSFGCIMYEIWSLGHKPFEEHTNLVVIAMLEHGFRLPPPPGCLKSLYSLMIQSWHPEASHRPSFSDLLHSLKKMNLKEEDGGYDQLLHLGAPLELGKNLYPDLQNSYIEQCSSENKQ